MILLCVRAEMLARLLQADPRGPDTSWLLAGPTDEAAVDPETGAVDAELPLAAE